MLKLCSLCLGSTISEGEAMLHFVNELGYLVLNHEKTKFYNKYSGLKRYEIKFWAIEFKEAVTKNMQGYTHLTNTLVEQDFKAQCMFINVALFGQEEYYENVYITEESYGGMDWI